MTTGFSCPSSFEELIAGNSDPLGLLRNVKPVATKTKALTASEQNFQEILDFYERTGRVPLLDTKDLQEKMLAARLKAYQAKPALRNQVAAMDVHGLLDLPKESEQKPKQEQKAVFHSFDELINNDAAGLLGDIDSSIFNLEHIGSSEPDMRNMPDEIASRKKCEDFFKFEKLFLDTQRDILNRKAEVVRFKNESQIEIGDMFIINGILCLVDSVLEESKESDKRENPRLRVIFENGIETNILKRSLSRALYKDPHGRRVMPTSVDLSEAMAGITHKDKATGCIYVLASETKAPELADLKLKGKLVKIGYSSQKVEERIKNAPNDPTYLEAPVRILASLDCYNLNPQKVEHLIHAFLAKQRLNMTLISSKGKPYRPTEWFAVDLATAVAVAEHIVAGDIMSYRMDNTTGRLKKIES